MSTFAYDFDIALMNQAQPKEEDNYKEVVLYNKDNFSKYEAVIHATDLIQPLLDIDPSLRAPTVDDVIERYVKTNPLFEEVPEEEDAFLYTTANDPHAFLLWEIEMYIHN